MEMNKQLDLRTIKPVMQGNRTLNVGLKSFKRFLELYNNLNINPVWQRGEVWTIKQQTSCIEFILKSGKLPPLLLNSTDNDNTLVLVDGKQRYTAIMLFLDNKLKVFNNYYYKDITNIDLTIGVTFQFNDLKTEKEVVQWYLDMIGGTTSHTEQEIEFAREFLDVH